MIRDADSIRQSEIHRLIDAYEDEHPDVVAGPDEDSLRAYFAGRLHADWPATVRWWVEYLPTLSVIAGGLLVVVVVWAVTG